MNGFCFLYKVITEEKNLKKEKSETDVKEKSEIDVKESEKTSEKSKEKVNTNNLNENDSSKSKFSYHCAFTS